MELLVSARTPGTTLSTNNSKNNNKKKFSECKYGGTCLLNNKKELFFINLMFILILTSCFLNKVTKGTMTHTMLNYLSM